MLSHLSKPRIIAAGFFLGLLGLAAGYRGYVNEGDRILAELTDDAKRCAAAFEPGELGALEGTKADVGTPVYDRVKARLRRLHDVNPAVRFVYIFRTRPAGKVIFLADSEAATSDKVSLPGDDYAEAAISPGLQATIRTGAPATEGPAPDQFGVWVTGYAWIDDAPTGRQILGMDVSAENWRRERWIAALRAALYVALLGGLPLAAVGVLRGQVRQQDVIRSLTEAMEQSHSALMIVDLASRITYANAGLCRQMGYERAELLGRGWREFQVAGTRPELLADLVAAVRGGQAWRGDWFNRRKNGEIYPVRGIITPVKNHEGRLACFVAALEDATESKKIEAELREARDRAEAGDKAKGQFLAMMSHEVRTPLNGIVGFTGLMLETALTAEQRDYAHTIRLSSEALLQLTGDILDFARIDSGKLKLEPMPCDVRGCVEDTLDLLAARAAEKGIELLHTVDAAVPAMVQTDPGRLRQVLVNLLTNAVKFTEVGEVEVRVSVAPATDGMPLAEPGTVPMPALRTLIFTVRDTGIGIPDDQQAKLFKPFTQVDQQSTRRYGGTGLGLVICRNLVRLMGGEIALASAAGRGTTFTFSIRAEALQPAPGPVTALVGRTLALIARPGPVRAELAALATGWGVRVVVADEPAELPPAVDLVLVEFTEALALAVARRPDPPWPMERTIGLVSLALPTELRAALRERVAGLLNKPARHEHLRRLLAGELPAAPLPVPASPLVAGRALKVLLVEDNAVNQRLTQRLLERHRCTWTLAENGRVALEALGAGGAEFDLVLMDMHMPEMDGLTAIRKIRAGEAGPVATDIWIVALTADARAERREDVFEAGANDFLTKPVAVAEFRASLERLRAARGA
ncbi:MAG: response regulator [Undibacterium sp.]|nr:response regulator [Opitutaceae bacterium]